MNTNQVFHERRYWLGFSVFSGIGPKKFGDLLEKMGTAEAAWNAKQDELNPIIGSSLSDKFIHYRAQFSLDCYIEELKKKSVWFLTHLDVDYPSQLNRIKNPPFLLFGKGDKELLRGKDMISIVGTRKVTTYGRQVTELLTSDLVSAGMVIVSGLAFGVDALAHSKTLECGGKTVAVLGCGVDCCYPSANEEIYQGIIKKGGAVISEYPLGMKPSIGSFPSRNRIIAGISTATLVTEGAEDSGSLITAHKALEYGRKVFAVPGPITSHLSTGPMKLIREGGMLITSAGEILAEIGMKGEKRDVGEEGRIIRGDTKEEQLIIDLLHNESMHFDELKRKTKFSTQDLARVLSMMEIKGILLTSVTGVISIR